MHMNTGITGMAGDGLFFFLAMIPFIMYLIIIVFVVYFTIKVIRFMNKKSKLDEERNKQLAELIQVLKQNQNKENYIS